MKDNESNQKAMMTLIKSQIELEEELIKIKQLYRNESDMVMRLTKENSRYREALEKIQTNNSFAGMIAREALKGGE